MLINFSQHGKSLYKVTRLHIVNFFFKVEPDGLTLIDTGLWGSTRVWDSTRGTLKAADAIGLPICRVAITHVHTDHGDHAGSLAPFLVALPEAELLMSGRPAAFLRSQRRPWMARLPEHKE